MGMNPRYAPACSRAFGVCCHLHSQVTHSQVTGYPFHHWIGNGHGSGYATPAPTPTYNSLAWLRISLIVGNEAPFRHAPDWGVRSTYPGTGRESAIQGYSLRSPHVRKEPIEWGTPLRVCFGEPSAYGIIAGTLADNPLGHRKAPPPLRVWSGQAYFCFGMLVDDRNWVWGSVPYKLGRECANRQARQAVVWPAHGQECHGSATLPGRPAPATTGPGPLSGSGRCSWKEPTKVACQAMP